MADSADRPRYGGPLHNFRKPGHFAVRATQSYPRPKTPPTRPHSTSDMDGNALRSPFQLHRAIGALERPDGPTDCFFIKNGLNCRSPDQPSLSDVEIANSAVPFISSK